MSLMQAIINQDISAVKSALRMRSALKEVDDKGNTVLHAAILTGNPKIVGLILDTSPSWEKNLAKQTPFDLARSLFGRRNPDDRHKIADMVGRYFDATYYQLLAPTTIPAEGCSRHYLNQINEVEKERDGARVHAALVHHSRKTKDEKSRFVLADVHAELRQVLARMEPPKDGNIATAAMTFELKVLPTEKRLYVTIPIKIPGKRVFTISDTVNPDADISLKTVLDDLKRMYRNGKEVHGNHPHFQVPKYDNSRGDAQLVYHSEQPLYYYLKSEEGATALVNRLITELRSKDLIAFGKEVKISHVAVHLHSTKTPCGPCETVIAGVQCLGDISTALKKAFTKRSYDINNKKAHLSSFSEPYHFSFPEKELRVLTTYSADNSDRHVSPRFEIVNWRKYGQMSEIELNSSIESNHEHVHVVKFQDKPPENDGGELSDYTVFSSASDVNKDVAKRKEEYELVNDDSLSDLAKSLSCMKSVEKQELQEKTVRSELVLAPGGDNVKQKPVLKPTGSPSYILHKPAYKKITTVPRKEDTGSLPTKLKHCNVVNK